ncbi:MAG: Circadian clock protein KaiC [Rhodospirillales bacterium]|nr:Circadian clock protein KaiC [Rhodospirillales bacterium]
MSQSKADGKTTLARMPTGIAGLDVILKGGFLRGGIYIIQGPPGAGKTILGNQVCYDHVAAGGKALYVTLLAENHDRMLMHMGEMRFFHREEIARSLEYISAFRILEEEGLKGLLTLIRREIQGRKISVLVLDGLVAAEHSAPSELEFKKFIHGLQTQAVVTDCTMFLLTSAREDSISPEHTMVDGLIELSDEQYGWRSVRDLHVRKFRGSSCLRGRHAFRITGNGIEVFPRTESRLSEPSRDLGSETRLVSTGVPSLDKMVGGGLTAGSTTLLVGPTGSGKTALGLQFLSGSSAEEPGLHFGFFESPAGLLTKSDSLGLKIRTLVEDSHVELFWNPPTEDLIDALAEQLLDAVKRRKVKRVVIDGLAGFQRLTVSQDRIAPFFTALVNELRGLGVTTFATFEVPDLIGPIVRAPVSELSTITENLMLLRYVELHSKLYRLISILKVRDSDFDPRLREFMLSDHGLEIGDCFNNVEALLTGFGRGVDRSAAGDNNVRTDTGG